MFQVSTKILEFCEIFQQICRVTHQWWPFWVQSQSLLASLQLVEWKRNSRAQKLELRAVDPKIPSAQSVFQSPYSEEEVTRGSDPHQHLIWRELYQANQVQRKWPSLGAGNPLNKSNVKSGDDAKDEEKCFARPLASPWYILFFRGQLKERSCIPTNPTTDPLMYQRGIKWQQKRTENKLAPQSPFNTCRLPSLGSFDWQV